MIIQRLQSALHRSPLALNNKKQITKHWTMRIYTNVHTIPGNIRKTYEITKMPNQKDMFLKKTWIDLEFVSS